ncbi:hypothetical protein Glove_43g94 [Diversispora epigaea]|uniref:Uncharacterized protein n=1 Tax=Diversispora epigaea TaxID=1348612 RepID=A0A397JGZ8_9GLOM|nr:hypothetical protein Glove_43g94 [Diversispora epigaea]
MIIVLDEGYVITVLVLIGLCKVNGGGVIEYKEVVVIEERVERERGDNDRYGGDRDVSEIDCDKDRERNGE